MKYTELDLQIEDIMWFGVDKNGTIFMATSGGCANVSAFVIDSKEETETLKDYFLNLPEGNSESVFLEKLNPDYPAYSECLSLTKNGITCFDVSDDDENAYKKIAFSKTPMKIETLPSNIQQILVTHHIDTDVLSSMILSVEHGF